MEHSAAIMQDAGDAIENAALQSSQGNAPTEASGSNKANDTKSSNAQRQPERDGNSNRKRKENFGGSGMHHGSRGRNGPNDNNKRHKRGDLGRGEYFRNAPDKRQRTQEPREKRQAGDAPFYGTEFTQEEINADEKKPKRKVAVLIGYSGTGYKGMQISASEKTIEGDLFNAFVAAGAISKANANDPRKSSLVRCARTDKGVHAAGNMISLKLIVEDEDIVKKINENLSPQIRVWGIERTIGSFSCYQACDSRWYEYLIPTHAFLPPHPSSWLAKRLEEFADEGQGRAAYEDKQKEVQGFWKKVEEEDIKPIIEAIDEDIRWDVIKALRGEDEANAMSEKIDADAEQPVKVGTSQREAREDGGVKIETTEEAAVILQEGGVKIAQEADSSTADAEPPTADPGVGQSGPEHVDDEAKASAGKPDHPHLTPEEADRVARLRAATRKLRHAYTQAKRRYRIPSERVDRIQAALDKYVGTTNFHNYTIQKTFKDPSAKRHIKSFVVKPKPILIGEGKDEDKSEWLSMKVHGQSFMMHQIRKMVGMVALLVRCGSDLSTMDVSFGKDVFSIPKVPGLGLLLERPVFDSYNQIQAPKNEREPLLFSKYDAELQEFKEREIYQRIFREEEERNEFSKFFNHVDNFKEPFFLFVTGRGVAATAGSVRKDKGEEGKSGEDI